MSPEEISSLDELEEAANVTRLLIGNGTKKTFDQVKILLRMISRSTLSASKHSRSLLLCQELISQASSKSLFHLHGRCQRLSRRIRHQKIQSPRSKSHRDRQDLQKHDLEAAKYISIVTEIDPGSRVSPLQKKP